MKRHCFLLTILFLIFNALAAGPAWTLTVAPAGSAEKPVKPSMEIVQGRPAIAWVDTVAGTVNYVRALDASGSAWGSPVVADRGSLDSGLCLRVVNGNPAICYCDTTLEKLKFTRSLDAEGNAWGSPIVFSPAKATGLLTMEVIQGNPAVLVTTKGAAFLRYTRAPDANGSAWGAVRSLDATAVDYFPSMKVVQGLAAFVNHRSLNELTYRYAIDASGAAWGPLKTIPVNSSPGKGIPKVVSPSLQLIGGNPAVAFIVASGAVGAPASSFHLHYVRSLDPQGNNWPVSNTLVRDEAPLVEPSLAELEGKPAIIYYADFPFRQLRMIQSTNSDGTEWGPPFTLNSGEPGGYHPTLMVVDGRPAICYSGITPPGVKFLRASDAAGSLWPADIAVTKQGSVIPDGGTAVFGTVMPGSTGILDFTIRNPDLRNEPLLITGLTIGGPDAAEFSLATAPETAVSAASNTAFSVRYAPASLKPAPKSAVLHIASNAQTSRLFNIVLTDKRPPVPGSCDQSFRPTSAGSVMRLAIQADGRILVSSQFGSPSGTAYSLTRILPSGTLDLSFFQPAIEGSVTAIAPQKDGKILIGGSFDRINGQPRARFARLLPDGSLDDSFAPATGSVYAMFIQPDGKIVAGGERNNSLGLPRLIRLNPDGSRDITFTVEPNNTIYSLALQPDGKILVGGSFTKISSTDAPQIARLMPDGSPDSLQASFVLPIMGFAVQLDGRFFAAGHAPDYLTRFLPDGRLDLPVPAVTSTNGGIYNVVLQTDGACVLAGEFTGWGGLPCSNIVRIDAAAQIDPAFLPAITGPPSTIPYIAADSMIVQADGRIIIGGGFAGVGGVAQANLARLENGPASSALIAADPSTVRWMRSGTAPEVRDVTFDLKPDRALEWSPLGAAHRIPGGWELSNLALPATGTLRAQAYAGSSVIESVAPILAPMESWKQQYFNSAVFTGDAADNADPDQDGLTNFTEFAFGLSPVDRAGSTLPEFKRTGNTLTSSFSTPAGRENILYGAEWSPSMLPGTWAAIQDTGLGGAHVFSAPGGAERIFVRFVVKVL